MITRIILPLFIFCITSCTVVPFKEPPPKDIPALKEFPTELQGFHLMTMMTKKGKVMEGNECRCKADVMDLEIAKNTMTVYDYRSIRLSKEPIDTSIISVNDSLIHFRY